MKLKYIINDDTAHYVQFSLDEAAQTITGMYVKDGVIEMSKTVGVSDILAVEPTKNPDVQIAKKGRVWDFHLIKYDAYGQQYRRSVGVLTSDDLVSTKLEMNNDTANNYTLKNYITHYLDVYNSSLGIADFPFDRLDGVTGVSSAAIPSLELTPDGQLKIGNGADVSLELLGEASLNASDLPFMMVVKIDSLAANDVSAQHQFEFQLGDNRFKVDTITGITLESPLSLNPELIVTPELLSTIAQPFVIRLHVDGTTARIFINDQMYILTNYHHATLIDRIRLYGFCNAGEYSLIDHVYMHALENYREDTIPPDMVQGVQAIAGDSQVLLKWDANTESDLAGYRVYVNSELHSFGLVTTNEYEVNDLTNGVPARISLVAVDKSGNAAPSTRVIEIKPVSNAAKEVSNADALISNGTVELSWVPPVYDDYNGINVYRINKADNSKVKLVSLATTATGYIEDPMPEVGRYIYLITTIDVHNNETSGVEIFQEIV